MAKKLKSYRDWLGPKLTDPVRAARYLNAAAEDSEAMFLKALRKVASAQRQSMSQLAEACGVSRESLYRMLSENGNPTSENRRAILAALGLRSVVVPIQTIASERSTGTSSASLDPERAARGAGTIKQGSYLYAAAAPPQFANKCCGTHSYLLNAQSNLLGEARTSITPYVPPGNLAAVYEFESINQEATCLNSKLPVQ